VGNWEVSRELGDDGAPRAGSLRRGKKVVS
jgi:hypothetical protein